MINDHLGMELLKLKGTSPEGIIVFAIFLSLSRKPHELYALLIFANHFYLFLSFLGARSDTVESFYNVYKTWNFNCFSSTIHLQMIMYVPLTVTNLAIVNQLAKWIEALKNNREFRNLLQFCNLP